MKVRGSDRFVPLDEAQGIPLGSTVDARSGVVVLSSQPKPGAEAQSAKTYAGVFRVTQPGSITNLKLVEKLSCGQGDKANIAAKRKKKRRLWGDGSWR